MGPERAGTLELYGCQPGDGSFASNCLLARRLAERGTRFIQLYHRDWDHHSLLREELPLRVLRTSGPYPEAVDLNVSPLAPGQTEHFRLTFDSISAQWNRQYPEMRVVDVAVK